MSNLSIKNRYIYYKLYDAAIGNRRPLTKELVDTRSRVGACLRLYSLKQIRFITISTQASSE